MRRHGVHPLIGKLRSPRSGNEHDQPPRSVAGLHVVICCAPDTG
ncbi:hypothetical protein MYA_3830 [Burkholderia sp. KJ006]|nr:hypothetical protein MYA_3830 [Burkholderia sp. KJ006]